MNKVIIMGRLTADPELRYTQSQTAVCRFRLAVDRYMGKDKENEADFINCTAWGKTAEHVNSYYFKGKRALVEGNIKTGAYDNDDGQRIYTTEVWVDRIEFADDKKKGEQNGQASQQKTAPTDAPPWDEPKDAFPKDNPPTQESPQPATTNGSNPPWMR